jgi:CubicO group peptidase (beta-lactamase class C family)
MVVGIVDEHGSRVYSAGKLDNGTERMVDGDTVFEIGSVTKTFTALLVLDMAERGEVKLDDPVSNYLPDGVKVPTHGGKEITLFNLAAQDSGLPFDPDNYTGADWGERFSSYTVPKMYEFLASYQLGQDPGAKFQYSNIGMGLLGHVMERRSGKDFDALVKERICGPLQMNSTGISLTPEIKARLAMGHDEAGRPEDHYEMPAIAGAGAMRSTVNDLLKFAAAQAGLTMSPLSPLVERSHAIAHDDAKVRDQFEGHSALPWFDEGIWNPPDSQLLGHAGGRCGSNSFVGFDLKKRVGVVVLTNQSKIHSSMLGWRILQQAHLDSLDPQRMAPVRDVVGIGVILDQDDKTKELKIAGAIRNSPADKAGLSGPIIVRSIDGTTVAGKSLADCLKLFQGAEGTTIRLEILDREGKAKTVELARQKYRIDS